MAGRTVYNVYYFLYLDLGFSLTARDTGRPRSMTTLFERMVLGPGFCRLFAFGFLVDRSAFALATDTLILTINFSLSVYGYSYVMAIRRQQLPGIWDLTTVMTVIKLHAYMLTPQITMVAWQFKRRAVTDLIYELDEIVSSIRTAAPKSSSSYTAVCIFLSIVVKFLTFGVLQLESSFKYFTSFDIFMVVFYNVWFIVPRLHYLSLMETIRQAVREINDRISGVGNWKTYRSRWKELSRIATHLARTEFGVMVVTFIVYAIVHIVFYLFMIYFVAFKSVNVISKHVHVVFLLINIAFNCFWLFEVFRSSHNCRLEVRQH